MAPSAILPLALLGGALRLGAQALQVPAQNHEAAAGGAAPRDWQDAPCGVKQSEAMEALKPYLDTPAAPQIRFYLHEEGPFNLNESVECFFRSVEGTVGVDDLDLHVLPNVAEHMTDYWLIQQLRRHPARTLDADAADLHVIGAPLFTSYAAMNVAGCDRRQHGKDLFAVAAGLKKLPQWHRNGGRDFLFIDTAPINSMGGNKVLNQNLRDLLFPHAILATADLDYWGNFPETFGDFVNNAIVLPYKAHFMVDRTEKADSNKNDAARDITITFHGDMTRGHGGRWVFMNITEGLENTSVKEHNSNSGDRRRDSVTIDSFQDVSVATAKTYMQSSFCLVSPGDSPTSRRLFDALASGCIPVLFGDFHKQMLRNLPFKASIDWSQIVLFGGSLSCVADNIHGTREWLRHIIKHRKRTQASQMRRSGQEAFKKLSYHSPGFVNALLREVQRRGLDL